MIKALKARITEPRWEFFKKISFQMNEKTKIL